MDIRRIGTFILLPPSFTGGERYMKREYYDAMAIVREFGKQDLFITMTCNQDWPEIQDALLDGQRTDDRPDVVARVFKLKLQAVVDDILKNQVFGKVVAYVGTIEFQKRGLPHSHMLFKLDSNSSPRTSESYDGFVCAEIPDVQQHPVLYGVVAKCMLHGPCGVLKPEAPCMRDGVCKKRFPKLFQGATIHNRDGYPLYRRRDGSIGIEKNGIRLDNRWVVPYNPYLCQKFQCHINVEICSTINCVKYLYKYVYKGKDRAFVSVRAADPGVAQQAAHVDETRRFLDGRYISAPEACWRLFGFHIQRRSHTVVQLAVHLPFNNRVNFNPDMPTRVSSDTMLTEFFKLCTTDAEAAGLFYHECPKRYIWDSGLTAWRRRRRGAGSTIGRMAGVSPADIERYHLRLLLCYIRGPRSYEDIRTVRGRTYDTFKEAAAANGFLEDDREWQKCMDDACSYQMPPQLRHLFTMILVHCNPTEPRLIWDRCRDAMSQDFQRALQTNHEDRRVIFRTLTEIDHLLRSSEKDLQQYTSLPQLQEYEDARDAGAATNRLIETERSYSTADLQDITEKIPTLNDDQRHAYLQVMQSVHREWDRTFFFVDGPGGTGKSFLLETILASVRSEGRIALAVATSGIAALQLMGGRTGHSTFKIPLDLHEHSTCIIPAQSHRAELIRACDLILWDEAPAVSKNAFHALDRTLFDLMANDLLFGEKIVVLAGDFRQTLPVVKRGTMGQIIKDSIKESDMWPQCTQLKLQRNMRVAQSGDPTTASAMQEFADFLLQVGEGRQPACPRCREGFARIPYDMIVQRRPPSSYMQELLSCVYPDLTARPGDCAYISERAILTPLNRDVALINDEVVRSMPGAATEYRSVDTIDQAEGLDPALYPTEFLNSLTIPGMPPHMLRLKVGTPIMLLRNINADEGLCNGTRLQVDVLKPNCLLATMLTGTRKGTMVAIPRIPLVSHKSDFPFQLQRRQFPVQLAYAMTINKSQGQTLQHVGIYLPKPVFAHGQLYAALSRATARSRIHIAVDYEAHRDVDHCCVKNIVYDDIVR